MMNKKLILLCALIGLGLSSCNESESINDTPTASTSFSFNHNWDGDNVDSGDFNILQYTNQNGDVLSIERLRYVISDIVFTGTSGERLEFDVYNLVDVTNDTGLTYTLPFPLEVPSGTYSNVAFTFGFDNEDNSENYLDLNSANFNVPDMLGGGYHYMQFDGKYLDTNNNEQPFNYHAIRAVDNPGMNPIFPQDTFFTVNLGAVTIVANTEIEIEANLAEWFKNPNQWDLNVLNTTLMPNSAAQILMYENGQSVFTLGNVNYQE